MEEEVKRAQGALLGDRRTSTMPFDLSFQEGVLCVAGEAEDLAQRRTALMLIREALGNLPVEDRIAIRQVPKRTDEEVARHLWDALTEDPTIDPRGIRIRVQAGRVTLEGEVDSLITRKLVGAISWWIPGVHDVDNRLWVNQSEEDGDPWILETIDVLLDKDFLIDRGQIMFSCKDGVVRLTGLVPSPEVRRAAENDMWAIEGVRAVINDLRVEPQMSTVEFR